jgi:hypothetical protein
MQSIWSLRAQCHSLLYGGCVAVREAVQEQEDQDPSDGDVKPGWQRDARDAPVTIEPACEREEGSNKNQRERDHRQTDVRNQNEKVDRSD